MPERIPQSTTLRLPIQAYLSSDHISPATGKVIAITISKNGGAYGNPSGGATNATEIASGSYYVDLSTTDTGTLGPLFILGTASATDNVNAIYDVVNANTGGLSALPNATPGAAGGVFIAGTNAATTVTTALTTTFTGNLTGSVGSVSGAVGSVTGNVGGNVTGSVGSVVGAVGSVTGNVGGSVASVTGNVSGSVNSVATTVNSTLVATGLDAITTTEPDTSTNGAMSTWNFRLLMRWVAMCYANGTRSLSGTSGNLLVKKLAGTTSTTQPITDDGAGNETLGPPT